MIDVISFRNFILVIITDACRHTGSGAPLNGNKTSENSEDEAQWDKHVTKSKKVVSRSKAPMLEMYVWQIDLMNFVVQN